MYSQAELGLESVLFYETQLRNFQQSADHARSVDDAAALAGAKLSLGRIKEKLREFGEAMALAYAARTEFKDAGDESGFALCCHTMAVWAFHQGDDVTSIHDFQLAAQIRERLGELLLSAQSWHNLAYVQCRTRSPDEALRSYRESRRILNQVRAGKSKDLSLRADRDLGFILSHLAFAIAKHRDCNDALTAAIEYFDHVALTKVHREPLLAYLAAPIALTRNIDRADLALTMRLEKLTGLPMQQEVWYRFALEEGRRAQIAHQAGSGRRPYLGARLLTLAEYGSWCLRNDRQDQGQSLLAEAVSLAHARGWKGEAQRFSEWACVRRQ